MECVVNRSDYRIRNKRGSCRRNGRCGVLGLMVAVVCGVGAVGCACFDKGNLCGGVDDEEKTVSVAYQKVSLIDEVRNETDFRFESRLGSIYDLVGEMVVPCTGVVTSRFGSREATSPVVSMNHKGIDIGANKGTSILAAHGGKVIKAGEFGTYGLCVMVENGELVTVYAHCSKVDVKVGDVVQAGERIARVGSTGNSTGNHLHFEVRFEGEFLNPEDVIDWS